MKIGDLIKKRREELGMSADTLAERIGVSRATIYRYENGSIEGLPVKILEPLAHALHVEPGYFIVSDSAENQNDKKDISDFEYSLVVAYRKAPEYMQQAICDMLHIKRGDASSYNSKVG